MLALLHEDLAHDLNQGPRECGRELFRAFLVRMNRCYREQLADIRISVAATAAMRRPSMSCTVNICIPMKVCRLRRGNAMSYRVVPSSMCVRGALHGWPMIATGRRSTCQASVGRAESDSLTLADLAGQAWKHQ